MSVKATKYFNLKIKKGLKNAGFTLVELIVSISIFVIITSLLLANQSKFNGSIMLINLAYEVALSVREAQSNALNVRSYSTTTASGINGNFNYGYGVNFSLSAPSQYIFFADSIKFTTLNGKTINAVGNSGSYDEVQEEAIRTYAIKRGNRILGFSTDSACDGTSGATDPDIKAVDITFKRPEAIAKIVSYGSNYSPASPSTDIISSTNKIVCIFLATPAGDATQKVIVRDTGQISIAGE